MSAIVNIDDKIDVPTKNARGRGGGWGRRTYQ